jgi:DNA polymerase-4
MDAFFASVEQLDNPALKGKPLLVGGLGSRGVVMAASYEAREYGIRSAMPMYQARQKCPHAAVVPPRRNRYSEMSKKIMLVVKQFSPLVEQVSIDEAYLDLQGCTRLFGSAETVAAKLKATIRDQFFLTCSIGIAPVKFLAKIASDMKKPDGLTVITAENVLPAIHELPIDNVPGVGHSVFEKLQPLGVRTLGDVSRISEKVLFKKLGRFGTRLFELSCGRDSSPVIPDSPIKSVSSEHTLSEDILENSRIRGYLLYHCEHVAEQLRKHGVRARTVTLKLKHADFRTVTRRKSLSVPIVSATEIYQHVSRLLESYIVREKIRLVGISLSGLVPQDLPLQRDLFARSQKNPESWEQVDRTLDAIVKKFGEKIVNRAVLTEMNDP